MRGLSPDDLLMLDWNKYHKQLADGAKNLAYLAKSLALAAVHGHRTVSVLFGHAAAGVFIAAALSSQSVVALAPRRFRR
jgi:hypothetical protein